MEHSPDAIDSLLDYAAIAFGAEGQSGSQLELNIDFALRSQRNIKVMHEPFSRLPTCAFADVRRNRNRGTAQLRRQAEAFLRRKTLREPIDLLNKRHRLLPHLEIAKRVCHLHDAVTRISHAGPISEDLAVMTR
jgi:hypothetical protein